jgi:hypothetical protein
MFTAYDRKYVRRRFNDVEDLLYEILRTIHNEEESEMAAIQDVVKSVGEQRTVVEGVTALLDGLYQQLKDVRAELEQTGGNTAALDEVIAGIQANTNKLAAAVARDTDANDEVHAGGM